MRPYERLADNEFEDLVGDLIGEVEGHVYERFKRGRDLGIDLRHIDGEEVDVIQCKHYPNSTLSHLRAAARKEADRLKALDVPPSRYRFVTSLGLTPGNKKELATILSGPWLTGPGDVLGVDDLEALLDAKPTVERRHVKLWLAGGTALSTLLNADVYNRSRALLDTIAAVLPLYVQTDAFLRAHEKLGKEHVCLISGRPGIGKTTLAQMLVADATSQGFEPIEVSYDVNEAWEVFDPEQKQIFYYDDFLGTTTLGELKKNEDQRLVRFIAAVATNPNSLFVLTTREYIYRQARKLYESFERSGIDGTRFLLRLSDYQRLDRAKILYNHVFHAANLPVETRHSLVNGNGYLRIVDHRLFNPRLIEAITSGYSDDEVAEGIDFVDYAVAVLDDPEVLWRRVYENQLLDPERALAQALVTMSLPAQVGDLEQAYVSLATTLGLPAGKTDFDAALAVLDDSLIETTMPENQHIANFVNPGVEDFIRGRLVGSQPALMASVASAVFFDQLRTLWSLRTPGEPNDILRLAIAEHGVELFESDSAVWLRIHHLDDTISRQRASRALEQRLVFLLRLIDSDEGFDALRKFAANRVDWFAARWRGGAGNEPGAVALVRLLLAEDPPLTPPSDLFEDMKILLKSTAGAPTDYQRLLEARELAPDEFSEEEMEEIGEQFLEQAISDLEDNPEVFSSVEEIDLYSVVAEELGIELDPDVVEQARDQLGAALDRREEMELEQMERGPRGSPAEQSQMDTLFARLLD